MPWFQSRAGVAMLLNVLIMGTMSLIFASVLARSSLDNFLDSNRALSALSTRADLFGCLDEAIIQLQKDNNYAATTVYVGDATCAMAITTPASGQRLISLSLTETDITRRVSATVTLSPFAVTQVTEP